MARFAYLSTLLTGPLLHFRGMTGPWTRDEASASGQVFEFRLWAALAEQSRGQLHVFLPLADRGVDALVHRLSDGVYVPVQAKGRSSLVGGEVHLVVWADSLAHDDVMIVSGLLVDGGLGPTVLVVPAGNFKQLADATTADGRPVYSMSFGMRPRSNSRWLPWLVPSERLVERFGMSPVEVVITEEIGPRPMWRSDLGFLGESEVVRRLAEREELNLFRPFPDSETAELLGLHLATRRVVGLQIKTVGIDAAHISGTVAVLESSFRPAPSTYFVILAWQRDERRFHDECLVIPSEDVPRFAGEDAYGHFRFEFHPGSSTQPRLDSYRRRLVDLRAEIEALVA
jgi:hypothetical protein